MNKENFIKELLEQLGMNADGALIGGIGAIVTTIGKVNGVRWKEAVFLIIGGLCISGYAVPALREHTQLGDGMIFFAMFMLGGVSRHVYKTADLLVPSLLKVAGDYLTNWFKKKTQ